MNNNKITTKEIKCQVGSNMDEIGTLRINPFSSNLDRLEKKKNS